MTGGTPRAVRDGMAGAQRKVYPYGRGRSLGIVWGLQEQGSTEIEERRRRLPAHLRTHFSLILCTVYELRGPPKNVGVKHDERIPLHPLWLF